jgi:hypothetical protein
MAIHGPHTFVRNPGTCIYRCRPYQGLRLPVILVWKDVQAYGTSQEARSITHDGATIPMPQVQQEVLSAGQPQPASPHSHEDGRRGCDWYDCKLHGRMGEDESAHADVEDLEELEGVDGGLLNIGVCEVEVEGAVHEVEGDEEGLITTNPTGYVAEPNGIHPMVGQDAYYQDRPPTNTSP